LRTLIENFKASCAHRHRYVLLFWEDQNEITFEMHSDARCTRNAEMLNFAQQSF
jgi:hypothetical protein